MNAKFDSTVRMISIDRINILNPRDRGRKKFTQIVGNIARLGLKKPITVTYAGGSNGEQRYDLVCGQGRLEAYVALGQTEIPVLIVEAPKEDLMLMGLAENLARRKHSTLELVREISSLKDRGYTHAEIARKTDLHTGYVRAILQLLAKGEERLLLAVEKGELPVNVAITIASSDDAAVQRALQEAYERNDLRGKRLIRARRLIEARRAKGKTSHGGRRRAIDRNDVTASDLVKTYHAEAMNHGGTYMTVSAHKRRNEVTVSIMPAGVSLSFDLTLDAGLALANEIRKAVYAARPAAESG